MRRFLVTANVVPNSLILVTLVMEVLHSSETWFPTRTTRRNIPEDKVLYFLALTEGANLFREIESIILETCFYILLIH
jgi:hypothetical protein